MRSFAILWVVVTSVLMFAITAYIWVWSITSNWSNDEATGLFLVTVFVVVPLFIGFFVFTGIGFRILKRAPTRDQQPATGRWLTLEKVAGMGAIAAMLLGIAAAISINGFLGVKFFVPAAMSVMGASALAVLSRLAQHVGGQKS